ncbi:MAG: hypothetical protein HY291_07980 [Planctomycetes bacterium]|nr:hypothetical protein [Planctomycetota bacterium]
MPAVHARIADAARELDTLRSNWLNPPEWVKEEVLEFPASHEGPWSRYVDAASVKNGVGRARYPRLVPKDAECAGKLAQRTLTNLYNQRPEWLAQAHRKLDEAVFAAYGWPPDLSDDEILKRLLDLNLSRAGTAAKPAKEEAPEAEEPEALTPKAKPAKKTGKKRKAM